MAELKELLIAERKAAFIADYFGAPEIHEKRRSALLDALEAHYRLSAEAD